MEIGRLNAAQAAGKMEPLKSLKPVDGSNNVFKTDTIKNNEGFYPGLTLSNKAPEYNGPESMVNYLDYLTNLLG